MWTHKVPDYVCDGWIHPDGRLWVCDVQMHINSAAQIVYELGIEPGVRDYGDGPVDEPPDDALDRLGFYRLMEGGDCFNNSGHPMSNAQLDLLYAFGSKFPSMYDQIQMVLKEQREMVA